MKKARLPRETKIVESANNIIPKRFSWRKVVFVLSIVALIYVIAANFSSLRGGLHAVRNGNVWFLALSLVSIALTYLPAAGVYWALSDRKLNYLQTLQVELAGTFTSRLLPADLGSIATNLRFISKAIGSKTAGVTIMVLNNLLSFLSYLSIGSALVLFSGEPVSSVLHFKLPFSTAWLITAGLIFIFAVIVGLYTWHKQVSDAWAKLLEILHAYKQKPWQLIEGFFFACGTTAFYLLAFYCSCLALNTDISFLQVFVAFTLGVTGSAIAPTPGGLGVTELGFYSGLYSTGIASNEALSIVLVYRLLTFWLPMPFGFAMFRKLLKEKIL